MMDVVQNHFLYLSNSHTNLICECISLPMSSADCIVLKYIFLNALMINFDVRERNITHNPSVSKQIALSHQVCKSLHKISHRYTLLLL